MFTPEAFINTVQDSKKQFVNTFVIDSAIKSKLVEVIDAQTDFAQVVAKNTFSISEHLAKSFNEVVKVSK